MQPFTTLGAPACPLDLANVDTDQLIPARFMTRPRKDGYGGYLLHDLRFNADGTARGLELDRPQYAGAAILVARRNFGTGSSREAAVYALADFGIRCVIAPSFGDIFAGNAVKNGVLPALVTESDANALLTFTASEAGPKLTVDLTTRRIHAGPTSIPFSIDAARRLQLLNGWDDLDLTSQHDMAIASFRHNRVQTCRWAWPPLV